MRLIDADALIRDLQVRYCKPCKAAGLDYNEERCRACQFGDEIDDIDGFADNSIDIVRCKECKHWEMRNSPRGWCVVHQGYVSPQYFCADGEREGE